MPRFTHLAGALVALLARSAAAQTDARTIDVGEDRVVVPGAPGFATVEPHLAANPRNPAHLVAGAIYVPAAGFESAHCAALASFDAGRSWRRHDFAVTGCGDPWVAVRPDGSALIVMIATVAGDSGTGSLLVYRSPDGGRTWSDRPVDLGRGHDHGTLTLDTTTGGPNGGAVYVTSEQGIRGPAPGAPRRSALFVARSRDGGATFEAPARVVSSSLAMTTLNGAVLSDGALVVPWGDFGRVLANGESVRLRSGRDWAAVSSDGGRTFGTPLFVTDACGRSFAQLVAFHDRLYYACNDETFEHVYLHHSPDRGERWSEPVVVNRGAGRRPYARTVVTAVNRDGVVAVAWYDARGDRNPNVGVFRCQQIYVAASTDGGRTFLPEVKVSSAPSCPDAVANVQARRRFAAGGDYFGLAAAADGAFHLLWADGRGGDYQLRAAVVRVK